MTKNNVKYREDQDSTFYHQGNYYSVNALFEAIEKNNIKLQKFKVNDLKWIIPYGTVDFKRYKKADVTTPICVVEDKGRLCTVDGYHRLCKATDTGVKELNGYLVDKDSLRSALVKTPFKLL